MTLHFNGIKDILQKIEIKEWGCYLRDTFIYMLCAFATVANDTENPSHWALTNMARKSGEVPQKKFVPK